MANKKKKTGTSKKKAPAKAKKEVVVKEEPTQETPPVVAEEATVKEVVETPAPEKTDETVAPVKEETPKEDASTEEGAKEEEKEEIDPLFEELINYKAEYNNAAMQLAYGKLVVKLVQRIIIASTISEVKEMYDVFTKCKYSTQHAHRAMFADKAISKKKAQQIATVIAAFEMKKNCTANKTKFDINTENIVGVLKGSVAKFILN